MRISFKARGLKKAQHMMMALAKMGAAYRGIEMHGRDRRRIVNGAPVKTGLTNVDVKQSLAAGGRDLGPNKDDAKKAAEAYVTVAEIWLRQMTGSKPPSNLSKKANEISAKAFRSAAGAIQEIISRRIDNSECEDGQVRPVHPEYAARRARAFDIPDDTGQVFKASGQLLANLKGSGGLKLVK